MLEKIGLPAKPSLRGGNWVVDASHCQGCSSQFTFINRKHHCRRCGGLFCNSCTQQRMILRGQGDSPVRICDPCKKLEDAARFELRYGHKSRTPKGNSKQVANNEEEVLNQILGTDGKQPLLSGREAHTNVVSDLQRTASTTSCSNLQEESATPGREEDTLRSMSIDNHALDDIGSSSPEELRQQAVEEKKKYRILKGERKPEEALQAFKRGKELERQAGALEIALRKSRIKASKASNLSSITSTLKTDNDCEASSSKRKLSSLTGKPEKDDLASELRELGWSDVDLHDADKKPAKLTLEGELSDLLGEIPQKSAGKGTGGIDKTQVIALKKKALMFKREGKLAEAKEELKRAKLLEKQLEEQELLGGAEDSDDELSALIHSMDDEKQDDLLLDYAHGPGINFVHLSGPADDLAVDGNFEVTDEDLNDPELAATLKSFGWTEENDEHLVDNVMQPVPLDQEALSSEILTLKREALNQKRVGNVAEAMGLLKKAKLLEKDIESMESDPQTFAPEFVQKSSTHQASGESSVARIAGEESVTETIKLPRKSKVVIQRELLGLKKKALALRREGRVEEAEEELRKGKVLEQQLEEMENAPKTLTAKVGKKNSESAYGHDNVQGTLDLGEEGVESDITEQDMHDPALLSVLKDLGWNDDDVESASMTNKTSKPINSQSSHDNGPSVMPEKATKSKAEIQKELLGLKRKALALRRQGKTEEAEEELRKAKDLENQMAEIEVPHHANSMEVESHGFESLIPHEKPDNPITSWDVPDLKVPDIDSKKQNDMTKAPLASSSISAPETPGFESHLDRKLSHQAEQESVGCVSILPQSGKSVKVTNSTTGGDRKILQSSAEELPFKENSDIRSFSHANASTQPEIQISAKGNTSSENEISSHRASSLQTVKKREITDTTTNKLVMPELNLAHGFDSSKDEILARKRKAVALKREGKLAEAREELRQAKLLEKSLEDAEQTNTGSKSTVPSTSDNTSIMQGSRTTPSQKPISGRDRFKLQQESLSHKRCALKLRREGKIEESEAEFELAKALENQLEEIGSHGPSKVEAMDDAVVEDLLDPQLMSALKAIGWQDTDVAMYPSKKSETKSVADTSGTAVLEKAHLEEQIKTEKLRALNLKRAGRQAEALEALRTAKRLEKKLDSFSS